MVREYSLRQESSVQYLAPDAIAELKDFERKHRLKLLDNEGKLVGFAELVYFSKPISAYYLEYMRVTKERRGQGFGSELIEQVNAFLKEKGKMGILVDAIEEDQAALGMYLSHGWKETYIQIYSFLMSLRVCQTTSSPRLRSVLLNGPIVCTKKVKRPAL